jgi:hypothetical protein
MVDPNPFDDVDRAIGEIIVKQLDIVRELDGMEADVTSWESEFLDSVLKQLEAKRPLTQRQIDIVHRMCNSYDVEFDL